MKKGKNITLLIGITCVFAVVLFQVIESIFHYFSILDKEGFQYSITLDIAPIVIVFLLLIIPVILLIGNLKNKTGKVLPIISIIINCVVLLWVLFFSFTPAIPQYLILSKLQLIDIYLDIIVSFLKNGGLLFVIGYAALIIGSFLSLPKKKKQKAIDDENTTLTDN